MSITEKAQEPAPLRLTNVDLGYRPTHDNRIIGMVFKEWDGTKDWELWEVWLGAPNKEGLHTYHEYHRIEYCKPAGIWYSHESGGGPINFRSGEEKIRDLTNTEYDGLYLWLAPNVERPWQLSEGSPQILPAPLKFATQEFFDNIFCHNELDFWCSECNSMIPGDWINLCSHTWWCVKCSVYSTPSERCPHSREESGDDE